MTVRVAAVELPSQAGVPGAASLRAGGDAVRSAMRQAAASGARVVLFHEGCLSYPHKLAISSVPGTLARADWSQADWSALHEELTSIAALARELSLWTVVHAPHRLSSPDALPHNSLYVISDAGVVMTRYDKRLLSVTEVTYLYTPGTEVVTFEVDGFRFGCAVCIEIQFPEVFLELSSSPSLDVDCVLFSSSYDADFLRLARAHASLASVWVAVAMGAPDDDGSPGTAIVDPNGVVVARGEVAVATLDRADPSVEGALLGNRPWRRIARAGELHAAAERRDDPRSVDRRSF